MGGGGWAQGRRLGNMRREEFYHQLPRTPYCPVKLMITGHERLFVLLGLTYVRGVVDSWWTLLLRSNWRWMTCTTRPHQWMHTMGSSSADVSE